MLISRNNRAGNEAYTLCIEFAYRAMVSVQYVTYNPNRKHSELFNNLNITFLYLIPVDRVFVAHHELH